MSVSSSFPSSQFNHWLRGGWLEDYQTTFFADRLHRLHPSKREVRIVDYVGDRTPMLSRIFEKRLRAYRAMGCVTSQAAREPDC
jgi:hypothetical protein